MVQSILISTTPLRLTQLPSQPTTAETNGLKHTRPLRLRQDSPGHRAGSSNPPCRRQVLGGVKERERQRAEELGKRETLQQRVGSAEVQFELGGTVPGLRDAAAVLRHAARHAAGRTRPIVRRGEQRRDEPAGEAAVVWFQRGRIGWSQSS